MKSFLTRFKSLTQVHYGERLQPMRDWLILLTVASVLLLVSLACNVWLFDRITNGESASTATSSPSPELNKDSLDAVKKVFTDRAAEEAKYQDGTYRFIDPSK